MTAHKQLCFFAARLLRMQLALEYCEQAIGERTPAIADGYQAIAEARELVSAICNEAIMQEQGERC